MAKIVDIACKEFVSRVAYIIKCVQCVSFYLLIIKLP